MDIDNILEQAQLAATQSQKKKARSLLREYMKVDLRNELAWLLFASVAESEIDETACLMRVLRINPNNAAAKNRLERIQSAYNAGAPDSSPQPTPPVVQEPTESPAPQDTSPTPPTAPERSAIPILLILIIGTCLVGIVISNLLDGSSSGSSSNSQTYRTYGRFTVPGTAYMDGRDIDANPTLTLMTMNVWDNKMQQPVCRLKHGTAVKLLGATTLDNRNYFHISSGSCEGWVIEKSLSTTKTEPVGDRIP